LKPSNVMVGSYGEVCVVDWGVAVSLDRDEEGRVAEVAEQQNVVGTLAYMPPEMLRSDAAALGRWSDVYLLCSTLYHVLSGDPPRMLATPAEYHEACDVPPVLRSDWPAPLRDLLSRGFAVDPKARPTLLEFREAIARYLARRDAAARAHPHERGHPGGAAGEGLPGRR
jgi:serine/threonine protein kinase